MFVRVEGGRVRLVCGFRDQGRVRHRTFTLPPDPDRLRELARRLEQAAAQLERERADRRPQAQPAPKPTRFTSRYAGLVLFGGPNGPVRFSAGRYETCDPAEVAWLRRHPSHGIDFHEAGRA